jgi:hypothetical protein
VLLFVLFVSNSATVSYKNKKMIALYEFVLPVFYVYCGVFLFVLFVFVQCLVSNALALNCSLLIDPSVFYNVYLSTYFSVMKT